ncbi:unnamed protein product [Lasius platythorax]|uniref:Uncharacterized protein n=1 Tax=Lasius platythorax TaxID=488582 RepID=A0AAV2N3A3_9HYME
MKTPILSEQEHAVSLRWNSTATGYDFQEVAFERPKSLYDSVDKMSCRVIPQQNPLTRERDATGTMGLTRILSNLAEAFKKIIFDRLADIGRLQIGRHRAAAGIKLIVAVYALE